MNRKAAGAVLLGALVLGGLVWLSVTDGRRHAETVPPGARQPVHETLRAAPLASTAADPGARVATPRAEPSLESEARAGRALRELARLFRAQPFERVSFDRAARSLARALARHEAESLWAVAAEEQRTLEERLAACELLCARDAGGQAEQLSWGARLEFGALARAAESSGPAESAARALAALGTEGDALDLVAELAVGQELSRARCARALVHARHPAVACALARLLETEQDPRTLDLAGATLGSWLAREGAMLSPSEHAEILARLDSVLRADPPVAVRRRVLAARSGLADEPAAEVLARGDPEEIALATPEGGVGLPALESALLDSRTSPERRMALAGILARARAEASPAARLVTRETLLDCVDGQGDPRQRRRALHALGAMADPASAQVLARHARFDPDPSLRVAGLLALRGLDARPTIAQMALEDPSPQLRELARRELERLDP